MAFSPDSKYLVTQGCGPEWELSYWIWEKSRGPMATVRSSLAAEQAVYRVTFNPNDNTHLCVTGDGILKMFRYSDGNLKQLAIQKLDPQKYPSQCWLSESRIAVGTERGRVLIFEGTELLAEIEVPADEDRGADKISCLSPHSVGFICASGTTIHFFEATDTSYRASRKECVTPTSKGAEEITNLALSPAGDNLVCSTDQAQIYFFSILGLDGDASGASPIRSLFAPFHSAAVTGLSACVRKPLIATCGTDTSVRIWYGYFRGTVVFG